DLLARRGLRQQGKFGREHPGSSFIGISAEDGLRLIEARGTIGHNRCDSLEAGSGRRARRRIWYVERQGGLRGGLDGGSFLDNGCNSVCLGLRRLAWRKERHGHCIGRQGSNDDRRRLLGLLDRSRNGSRRHDSSLGLGG